MRTGILDPTPPGTALSSAGPRVARARAARRRAALARRRRLVPVVSAPALPARQRPRATGSRGLSDAEIERQLEHLARVLVRTMRAVPMPGVAPLRRRDLLLIAGIVVAEALVVLLFGWAAR